MQKIFIVSPIEARNNTKDHMQKLFRHAEVIFQTDEYTFDVVAVEECSGKRTEIPELRTEALSELFHFLYTGIY
jgi:hypothetical protein